jgi:hypothetical protein
MFSKRSTLLATAFAVLFVVSTLPLAAQETGRVPPACG